MAVDRARRPGSACSPSSACCCSSLLGVRLWFLQTVKADELQETRDVRKTTTVRARCPSAAASSTPTGGSSPTTSACSPSPSTGRCSAARPERARDLHSGCRAGSRCRSRRWRPASSPRCTARSCRCRSRRTSTNRPRSRCSERVEDFPGVEIIDEWKRVYPYAPHASHVVGYMGAHHRRDSATRTSATTTSVNERVGQFGVELQHGAGAARHVGLRQSTRSTPPTAPCA